VVVPGVGQVGQDLFDHRHIGGGCQIFCVRGRSV